MDKVILKPTAPKIVVSWLTMCFIVLILIVFFNLNEFSDFMSVVIIALVALFQTFIFNIIYYNLPYFKIEINDSHLIGPRSLGWGWMRAKILISDIDLNNINSSFQWLGIYIIKSYKGEKISVWGFDKKQFRKLMDLLNSKQQVAL